jgi:arsenite methyltransferase
MTDYLDHPIDFNNPSIASTIDEVSYWASRFADLMFRHLELRPNLNVLDIGCATGVPLFELAHMHDASCQFTGVDIWQEALDRAQFKLDVYGLPNVKLLKIDGNTLPFSDAHFDLIISNLGVNNFDNPQSMLAECVRVAKPNARFVITTNIVGHMHEFYDVYRAVLQDFGKPEYLERLAANEAHRGTRESHIRLIESAGFQISKVVEDTFAFRYLDGSAFLRHWFIRLGFLDQWRKVVDQDDERVIFADLEAWLNMLAQERSELKMTIPMLYVEAVKSS